MAVPEKEPSQIPVYAAIALLLTATGVFFFQGPLKSFRPAERQLMPVGEEGAIEARLWEDPIETVRKHRTKIREQTRVKEAADREFPLEGLVGTDGRYLIMPIVLPGGRSVEDYEARLRTRYALQAAVDTAGYIPAHPDRLRFHLRAGVQAPSSKGDDEIIPYEWFHRDPLRASKKPATGAGGQNDQNVTGNEGGFFGRFNKILVLWIQSNVISRAPLNTLLKDVIAGEIIDARDEGIRESVEIAIIGPSGSDSLREICIEIRGGFRYSRLPWKMYSPWATADPNFLMNRTEKGRGGFQQIVRTIRTDDKLVAKLMEELQLRGINCCGEEKDHIAIISEWDTYYGRALPQTFLEYVNNHCGERESKQEVVAQEWPENLHRVVYLRGIDGAVPDEELDTFDKAEEQRKGQDREDLYNYERPEGSSQLDYVRRLSEKLHKVEEKRKIRFKAIGILGSDVYDKLLLLQALRTQFSHALFFTTDLDARLLHPSQNQWARNLIVVSSYGLDLSDPALEEPLVTRGRMLPPFRGVYQSAVFVAVLEALGTISSEYREDLSKPKIYEVGRTQAKLLTATRTRGMRNTLEEWWWLPLLIVSILLILAYLRFGPESFGVRLKGWIPYFVFIGIVIAGCFYAEMKGGKAPEAFEAFEGISIWPSEIIRLLAAFLALHFLLRSHRTLAVNNKTLADEFSLSTNGKSPRRHGLKDWWRKKWQPSFKDAVDDLDQVEVERLWAEYVRFGKPSNTYARVLCLSVLYALLGSLMISSLGEPIVPYRGPVSKFADIFVLFGSVSLLILLIFNVVDLTLSCERFVRNMSERVSRWPKETVATWSNAKWEPGNGLEEWLDIRMIAKRTQVVGALIVGPFLVLFFMILSRVSLFDKWDWPISLIIIFGFHSILAISAVILLNRAAKRAKGTSLERLGACRVRVKDDENEVRKIDILIEEIEKIEQGAFAPLSRQPVLRAFLVPFGGILFVLSEYLGKFFG